MPWWKIIITPLKNYASDYLCGVKDVLKDLSPLKMRRGKARYDDTYIYALLHKEWTK